jgi:preprotein translocase subunit SecA
MDRMGYKEGEVIQHSMVSKSIERAQKKVEENNFGIRKRLLEYDDVMNSQRDVIYNRRKHALFGDRLAMDISNMLYDLCEELITLNAEARDYDNFKLDVIRYFATNTAITEDELLAGKNPSALAEKLFEEVRHSYKRKGEQLSAVTMPVLADLYQTRGATIENVVIPFSDSKRTINVVSSLKKAVDTNGREVVLAFEKGVTLSFIDDTWKEHLREMDELKNSVQSAVYEQKDPLLIYKLEAFNLFKDMVASINRDITSFLYQANVPFEQQKEVRQARDVQRTDMSRMKTGRDESNSLLNPTGPAVNADYEEVNGEPERKPEPIRVEKKVGRNEPCPCGSGKKYKNCHGKDE